LDLVSAWSKERHSEEPLYPKPFAVQPSILTKDYTQRIYKHIIGLAAFEKLIKIPSAAKSVPISQKPKRDRPGLAKGAYVLQPIVDVAPDPDPAPAPSPSPAVYIAPTPAVKSRKRKATEDYEFASMSKKPSTEASKAVQASSRLLLLKK